MKTNLSSQIKLERVPVRYYNPQSDIERAELTRNEKVYTRIFETSNDGSNYLANHIVELIKRNVEQKGYCNLAIGAGRSTHSVYVSLT